MIKSTGSLPALRKAHCLRQRQLCWQTEGTEVVVMAKSHAQCPHLGHQAMNQHFEVRGQNVLQRNERTLGPLELLFAGTERQS